ncbi:MAG: hypothetical protein GY850_05415 [bacterium]|nr:hypothetical protein [bacterium]
MDRELAKRWSSAAPPFTGVCLYPDDALEITDLVKALTEVCTHLRETFGDVALRKYDDWLQHDGFVSGSEKSSWVELDNVLRSEKSLYEYRHDDDFVNRAFYPEDFSFLLRFDVFEEDDDEEYPGIWGDFDICGDASWIEILRRRLASCITTVCKTEPALQYYDRISVGYAPSNYPADGPDREAPEETGPGPVPPAPSPPDGQAAHVRARIVSLAKALEQHDAEKILPAIQELDQNVSALGSDQKKYLEALVPHMAWDLFSAERLDDLLVIAGLNLFHKYDLYQGLTTLAAALDTEFLLRLVGIAGFPWDGESKKGVYRELVTRSDPLIFSFLKQVILNADEKTSFDGQSFSEHKKTFSQFQFVRLAPEGRIIAEAIEILSKRLDPEAPRFIAGLLVNPPWPPDSAPYVQLIEAAGNRPGPLMHDALMAALNKINDQFFVRRLLLGAVFYYDPNHATRSLLRDLAHMPDDQRLEHVRLFERFLNTRVSPDMASFDLIKAQSQLEELDTRYWSWAPRGYLKKVAAIHFPGKDTVKGHGLLDGLAIFSVKSFQTYRIDHMGCGIILPILLGAGWLLIILCDYLFGKPQSNLAYLDNIMLLIWVLVVGGTATTHFSGHESMKGRLIMSIIFWLATLAFPTTLALVHLAPYFS